LVEKIFNFNLKKFTFGTSGGFFSPTMPPITSAASNSICSGCLHIQNIPISQKANRGFSGTFATFSFSSYSKRSVVDPNIMFQFMLDQPITLVQVKRVPKVGQGFL
jgi:hypothetical protein